MKHSFLTLLALTGLFASASVKAEDGWTTLFNGKDLTGWKSNEAGEGVANVFTVADGVLKVDGGRSHLFYMGPDGKASFKNFELKLKVMTTPKKPDGEWGSNSGVYFHTEFVDKGWPVKGFECQVNSTHKDIKKTGGLYAVKDVLNNAPSKDNEWFDYDIKVEGKHVVLSVNGVVTSDWTQPEDWDPKVSLKGMDERKIGQGTFALQGHDPKSTTFYKDIMVKVLP